MPFTDHSVTIDGCKTHYRRSGKGAPLVFLHGASGAPVVLPFMEKLATRFDVLVPDHPGYGQSDEPGWLENIHDVAYFYLDFLAHLKLERAVLVGSSMGGWMAMAMAHELKRLLPKAELNILERCGHLPQVEKMDEFCDLVVRFACK